MPFAGPQHPDHLREHGVGKRHALEHVGAVHHLHRAGGERQHLAVTDHGGVGVALALEARVGRVGDHAAARAGGEELSTT